MRESKGKDGPIFLPDGTVAVDPAHCPTLRKSLERGMESAR